MGFYLTHKNKKNNCLNLIHIAKLADDILEVTTIKGLSAIHDLEFYRVLDMFCCNCVIAAEGKNEGEFLSLKYRASGAQKLEDMLPSFVRIAQELRYERNEYKKDDEGWTISDGYGGFITQVSAKNEYIEITAYADAPFAILQRFTEGSDHCEGFIQHLHDEFTFAQGLHDLFRGDDVFSLQDFD